MPSNYPRRTVLAAGLGAASALPAPALAQAQPEIRWRLSSGYARNVEILFGASERLARLVAEASDNRFQIQVAPVGDIVAADGLIEAVGTGKVEMGHAHAGQSKDPAWSLASSMPFGLNARGQYAWWLHAGGAELMAELFAKQGLEALPGGNTGAQMGGWFRKEIKTLADFQGLKLRIAALGSQLLAKLGAVPQSTPGQDLFGALESKALDAAEWIGPYDDERLGLQKVAPTYHFPGFWEGGAMLFFWINAEKAKALPKAYRAILREAAAEVHADTLARYDARNPQALRRLVAGGATLRPFPQDVLEGAYKAANDLYAELSAKNADFKRVYEALKQFRNEEYLWFQVAEYTYDNFMMRARSRS